MTGSLTQPYSYLRSIRGPSAGVSACRVKNTMFPSYCRV